MRLARVRQLPPHSPVATVFLEVSGRINLRHRLLDDGHPIRQTGANLFLPRVVGKTK